MISIFIVIVALNYFRSQKNRAFCYFCSALQRLPVCGACGKFIRKVPFQIVVDDIFKYFVYFAKQLRLDISCGYLSVSFSLLTIGYCTLEPHKAKLKYMCLG